MTAVVCKHTHTVNGEGEVGRCEAVESVRREEVSGGSGPPTPTTRRQETTPTKSKGILHHSLGPS